MEMKVSALKDIRKPEDQVRFYIAKAPRSKKGDWSRYGPKRFHQDGQGMCVGCGLTTLCHSDSCRHGIIRTGLPLHYSPIYQYNWGRKAHGWLGADTGSYPEDVAESIVQHGLMLYEKWPCVLDKNGDIVFDKTDPATRESEAVRYPNCVKARVNNGVDGLIEALGDGSVSIAVPWFSDWDGYTSGVLPKITKNSKKRGRHNMLYDGWDEDLGLFFGPNSWGNEWGVDTTATGKDTERGRFVMDMEAIEIIKAYHDGYDAWDIDYDSVSPEAELAMLKVITAGSGGYGSGAYKVGQGAEIYAGAIKKYHFITWSPIIGIAKPTAAKTVITLTKDTEVKAVFGQDSRCKMFTDALLKKEGL